MKSFHPVRDKRSNTSIRKRGCIKSLTGFQEKVFWVISRILRGKVSTYREIAKEAGVKMVINTDSHHKSQLRFIELGIAQARRGWAEKRDIINTQPLEKLLKFFK